MAKSIEKELNTLITETHYSYLKKFFNLTHDTPFTQENYYFDTIDTQLINNKMGLRLRVTTKHNELTLKIPIKKGEKLEITDYLDDNQAAVFLNTHVLPDGNVLEYLRQDNLITHPLQQIGYLKNERFEVKKNDTLFVLDRSHFKDGIQYELEFEYVNQSDTDIFYNFLKTHKIPMQKVPSKMKRATALFLR